jgi:hypothetical protein
LEISTDAAAAGGQLPASIVPNRVEASYGSLSEADVPEVLCWLDQPMIFPDWLEGCARLAQVTPACPSLCSFFASQSVAWGNMSYWVAIQFKCRNGFRRANLAIEDVVAGVGYNRGCAQVHKAFETQQTLTEVPMEPVLHDGEVSAAAASAGNNVLATGAADSNMRLSTADTTGESGAQRVGVLHRLIQDFVGRPDTGLEAALTRWRQPQQDSVQAP